MNLIQIIRQKCSGDSGKCLKLKGKFKSMKLLDFEGGPMLVDGVQVGSNGI